MKSIFVIASILLGRQFVSAQDSLKTTPKQVVAKKVDNYTIQRLIVSNDKGEMLMQKNKFGWFTPSIRSNENQSLKEGLDSLATAIGIKIGQIKLSGIFSYKYNGLSDHIGVVSYRTHYSTKYKSGELIQPKDPKDTTREFRWIKINDAIEMINMSALKEETRQIIKYPKEIWGGSYLLNFENETFKSADLVEKFYSLSGE